MWTFPKLPKFGGWLNCSYESSAPLKIMESLTLQKSFYCSMLVFRVQDHIRKSDEPDVMDKIKKAEEVKEVNEVKQEH